MYGQCSLKGTSTKKEKKEERKEIDKTGRKKGTNGQIVMGIYKNLPLDFFKKAMRMILNSVINCRILSNQDV